MATVRRVRRIIRKIDPVDGHLKVSAVVWAVLAVALVLGMVIFWSVLERAGDPEPDHRVHGGDHADRTGLTTRSPTQSSSSGSSSSVRSSGWVISMTGMTVAGRTIVYNLVSDVVGGLEIVVLEESLNPVVPSQQVLHPPNDYRAPNGVITPPPDHADLPTEEVERAPTEKVERAEKTG
jgi:hypothetical protein